MPAQKRRVRKEEIKVLEYLLELVEGVLAEFDGFTDLSQQSDREVVSERLLEVIQDEFLSAYPALELQDEVHRLHDENDSLWEMLEELKDSDVVNAAGELGKIIETKLVELKSKTLNRVE
tara:strand:- start:160 stop:519 length:360 start_codon:yes stop_codon:yes gene_type:complete